MSIMDFLLGLLVGGYFIGLGLGAKFKPEQLRGNKFMLAFGIVILLGNFAITFAEKRMGDRRITVPEMVAGLKGKVQLPVQMDAQLRLEDIKAASDRVIYEFSVAADDRAGFERKIAEINNYMKEKGCTMGDSAFLLKSGVMLQLIYAAPVRLNLPDHQILIEPKACGYAAAPAPESP